MAPRINIAQNKVEAFCEKWLVTDFELFGSVLREDFGPQSDIDVLLSFTPEAHWSLLDLVDMKEELEAIFERPVDVLTRRAVEASTNWLRRRAILEHTEKIYARG